jgi:hypothetical protein
MSQHHITYIRDSDRTRVIFAYSATDYSQARALELAACSAPRGFRHAATRIHEGGPVLIPSDGDDYGREFHSIPAAWKPVK